ncbi:MAG TPA: fatty acid desaturase [Polyangiaceae bacterium]|nr:fatty acid desaturase [Polyangiaceae bacterium]
MGTPFLRRVLEEPRYGWSRGGELYRPTGREIVREWGSRMNLFASRKTWLSISGWGWTLALFPFGIVFLTRYFSWPLMLAGFLYSMVGIGTHGTVWLHRYSTHRAFGFRTSTHRFICRNLAIKIVPEETYVISHLVHHAFSDAPGDPYNARAGWLYCFLAGELHQPVNRSLPLADYERLCALVRHTGMYVNTYEQYGRWGSIAHPARTTLHYALNWLFWYGAFYLIGGHAMATALFGWSAVWAVGIRAHNYDLHAGGKDRRRAGVDFDRRSLAINRLWPGLVAGEWHNNHHLFPNSARSGFLPWQLDISFAFIRLYALLGGVTSVRDARAKFYEKHYEPYVLAKQARLGLAPKGAEATRAHETAQGATSASASLAN